MKIWRYLYIPGLGGCASMTGSKNQPVSVETFDGKGNPVEARCIATNDKGQWHVRTPGSLVFIKSTQDLAISCKSEDHAEDSVFQSKSNGGVWGNILAGGLVGYVVDSSTGAGFDYPPSMHVSMKKVSQEKEAKI